MQGHFLAGVMLIAFPAACAFAADPASRPSTAPAVTQLQVPNVRGPDSRYWLASNLTAFCPMGFAEFDLNPGVWGIGSSETETAHFRLANGRHAIGFFEPRHAYSLVLVYTAPPGTKSVHLSTDHASLEAWLVRRKHEHRNTPPVDEWLRFLEATGEEKLKMPNVFRLFGTGTIQEDKHGLLKDLDLDVSSRKPLPPFTEWLDEYEKEVKDLRFAPEEERQRLFILEYYRAHPATKPARISGDVVAGWGPPRSGIISSP